MNQKNINQELAQWNDQMVKKHHSKGVPLESKNIFLRTIEKMRLKKIIQLAQLKKNDLVLDLGCGEGSLISLMPDLLQKIVGLDISKIALSRARKNLKEKEGVELRLGNAENLDLPNESFDKIICSEMLEHVPRPRKVMKEIHKILKNDGLLVISVPDEKRIQFIMKIAKILYLNKILGACREEEEYDWHLHRADKKFITDISKGLFEIQKIYRIPSMIGYHFIATLAKK
ncbi:MAG: class I SAM-dependent methyltransferase [Patescibacteria group bacterium]|nr:class I SAM-dependent methyltransferase [Patescibacteria group bacterium]